MTMKRNDFSVTPKGKFGKKTTKQELTEVSISNDQLLIMLKGTKTRD